MKKILIILLALMPVMAQAQQQSYIDLDDTNIAGRIISTKPAMILSGYDPYLLRFLYNKSGNNEVYAVDFTFCGVDNLWTVEPNTIGVFSMASGEKVTLQTYTPSTHKRGTTGYHISTLFLIPDDKLLEMLDALIKITIITDNKTYDVSVDYDTASVIMLSYLELLSKTGK